MSSGVTSYLLAEPATPSARPPRSRRGRTSSNRPPTPKRPRCRGTSGNARQSTLRHPPRIAASSIGTKSHARIVTSHGFRFFRCAT